MSLREQRVLDRARTSHSIVRIEISYAVTEIGRETKTYSVITNVISIKGVNSTTINTWVTYSMTIRPHVNVAS